jgi:predicted nucleotidyltransferase component of viral defense system
MNSRSDAQSIEVFHLLFLQVLTTNAQNWFVLKGGANLRYFFGSVRYSNDIDLDYFGRPGWKVEQSVDAVLEGKALTTLLRQQGLLLTSVTKPKQTDTTRRWKIALAAVTSPESQTRTKIEFSGRRQPDEDRAYEVVPAEIVDPYGVTVISVEHYRLVAALEQKVAALALRSETKARDVFDLELLFRQYRASGSPDVSSEHFLDAAARALEVTFENFRSEVLPFLDADIAEIYDSADTWTMMRSSVSDSLESLAAAPEDPRS